MRRGVNEDAQVFRDTLGSVDALLRNVIAHVETNVNTPTREWSFASRKLSMENLVRRADQALVLLEELIQRDVWIKHAFKFVDCVESIKCTARHACFGESRCWGRTDLRQAVARLKESFGNGCEFENEAVAAKKEQPPGLQIPEPTLPGGRPRKTKEGIQMVDENDRPYSVKDLMVLHNLSHRAVVTLYENEPGVLILQASRDHQKKIGRRYRTIRVPQHVYRRVKHRLENR